MIRQRYPEHELKVEVANHPVPQLKQVIYDQFDNFLIYHSDHCLRPFRSQIRLYPVRLDAVRPVHLFWPGPAASVPALGVGEQGLCLYDGIFYWSVLFRNFKI